MNRIALGALALGLLGCPGGGGSGGSGPRDWQREYEMDPKYHEFAADYTDAVCSRLFACCTTEQIAAQWEYTEQRGNEDFLPYNDLHTDTHVHDEAECRDVVREAITEELGKLEFDEDRLFAYDAAVARRCLTETAAQPCTGSPIDDLMLGSPVQACPAAFRPLVQLGGECNQTWQCASGSCAGDGEQPSRCRQPTTVGEACVGGVCTDDQYCDDDGVCQRLRTGGDACTADWDCASHLCTDNVCEPTSAPDSPVCTGP